MHAAGSNSRRPLTGKFREIMYGSDHAWSEHYSSKFCARRGVILHAVNLGWSYQDCRAELGNPMNAGSCLWRLGSNDRVLPDGQVTKRLTEDYKAACRKYAADPPVYDRADARIRIGELTSLIPAWNWHGVSGRTDHDVISYVLSKMTDIGSTRINVASRDVSIGAGVSQRTALRSLTRLVNAGWLRHDSADAIDHAPAYEAVSAAEIMSKLSKVTDSGVTGGGSYNLCEEQDHMSQYRSPGNPSHETWVRLGKSSKAVYDVLTDDPVSARAVSKAASVSKDTANKKLPELRSYDLAAYEDGWIIGTASPDQVCNDMGWIEGNSKVRSRIALIADEREHHRKMVDTYRSIKRVGDFRKETPREEFRRLAA
jgi:hypothetical protein